MPSLQGKLHQTLDSISLTVQRVVSRLLAFEVKLSPVPIGMKISSSDLINSRFAEVIEGIGRYIFDRPILGLDLLVGVATGAFPFLKDIRKSIGFDR